MKIIYDNKKDTRNYEIIDRFECGIVLAGWEVKSARASKVSLSNSYCSIYKGQMYLKDSYLAKYMAVEGNEYQDRKLLLHKAQIKKIAFECDAKGFTIIPTKLYFTKTSKIKLEIAVAKGLKKYDKRQKIIEREVQKRLEKTLKSF
ncbi:SsrA-binding protein [Mycoplasmopsis pullorum]|uniref:SsrA-binding protein n=1 Tax=Mycoplasmopsis pullorum TaxID=48003 RepID=UPI00111B7EAF|nr:SsrA-binding protein [Mycoplasmopsis pullorum]TNK85035.1 SsrA-binding protein [Mycoplasmopsis pullorum]